MKDVTSFDQFQMRKEKIDDNVINVKRFLKSGIFSYPYVRMFSAAHAWMVDPFNTIGLAELLSWLFNQVVNHHLLKDLTELGVWNDEMKNQIIAKGGSIQVNSVTQELFLSLPVAVIWSL